MRVVRNIIRGAQRECNLAQQDQLARQQAAELLNHRDVARYYQQQIFEINELGTHMQRALESIQDWSRREPERLHSDLSVILSTFEHNNLVGLESRPFIIRRSITAARRILEEASRSNGIVGPSGHFLVWFRQIYNLMDTLFQTRTALSMYYHSVLEA